MPQKLGHIFEQWAGPPGLGRPLRGRGGRTAARNLVSSRWQRRYRRAHGARRRSRASPGSVSTSRATRRSARPSSLIAEAWRELRPLPGRAAAARPAARGAPARAAAGAGDAERGGDRRRRPRARREPRPAAAALLRLHRLLGPRDRRDRRRARRLLRRQPRRLGRRRLRGRGAGGALGGRVRRLPGRGGLVHERRHRVEPDGADRGARAGAARARGRTASAGSGSRSTAPQEVHYSVVRAAELLGIGSAWVRALPIDGERRLRADAVATAIDADRENGIVPVAVVASAGTTLTGAVDPIDELADICAERGIWLHVDGAYGLPAARTPTARHLFTRARARRLRRDRRAQVALPAEVLRRRPRPQPATICRRRSATRASTSRTTVRSCTPPTSRSSTRGRSARSSSGSRCGRTAPTRSRRRSSATCSRPGCSTTPSCERPELEPLPLAAAALDRPVPPRPGRRRRRRRAQLRDRAPDPGGRRVLGRARAHRREDLHPALHRQLPHERRRRARLRRAGRAGRAGARRVSATSHAGAWVEVGADEDAADGTMRRVEIEGHPSASRASTAPGSRSTTPARTRRARWRRAIWTTTSSSAPATAPASTSARATCSRRRRSTRSDPRDPLESGARGQAARRGRARRAGCGRRRRGRRGASGGRSHRPRPLGRGRAVRVVRAAAGARAVHWQDERDGRGFWSFTRYDDIVAVSKDHETYSSEAGGTSLQDLTPEEVELRKSMIDTDPPRHTRLRAIVNQGFTPKVVNAYEERIRGLAREILARAFERERVRLGRGRRVRAADVGLLGDHGAAGRGPPPADRPRRQAPRQHRPGGDGRPRPSPSRRCATPSCASSRSRARTRPT